MKSAKVLPTSTPRSLHFITGLVLSVAIACGISSGAMADDIGGEVLLNSSSITLGSSSARLIRTSMTPSKVEINLPITTQNTVCTEYAEIPHTGQNGARCGYDYHVRRVCRDIPGQCHTDRRTGRTVCAPTRRECYNQSIQIPRFCTWYERECVRTDVVTSESMKRVCLKFKKMARLSSGEMESFDLQGRQRSLNASEAVFSMDAISTKRPVSIKARDGIFTGFKDVITIKGK
jgi:hypothetical protein